MLDGDRHQLPLVLGFGDQFLDFVDDHAGIRFVFEVGDSGLPLGMVAGRPEKEHYRPGRWITYLRQESGWVEGLGYDRNSSPYCCPFHRLEVYGAPPILYLRSSSGCLCLLNHA